MLKNGYPQDIAFSVLFLWNSYILLKLNGKAVWGYSASRSFEPAGKGHAMEDTKYARNFWAFWTTVDSDTADRRDLKFNACAI
jgi:hypothetical protein